jgi:nucleoside 2-deoxyribosyltransferase
MTFRAKIYIAGPYSKGNVAVNIKKAIKYANELSEKGFAPFIPHLSYYWNKLYPKSYEFWMQLDFEFVKCCDGIIRIDGESAGADREIELAKKLNIPIFNSVNETIKYFCAEQDNHNIPSLSLESIN